jgi:ABC-type uncharacterized transport system involved in gliding motility auxiliary subunit
MSRKRRAFPAILAIFAILMLCSIALASGLPFHYSFDFTNNHRFTLSTYTREVLSALDSEVKITWYRSANIGRIADNEYEIECCLDDFRTASRKRLSYEIRDPSSPEVLIDPDTIGITPRHVQTDDYYSGILIEHHGRSEIIPFVSDRSTLEYNLLLRILSLSGKTQNDIQILFGGTNGPESYGYIVPWLDYSGFTVRELSLPAHEIGTDMPLLVIGSTEITHETATAISTFLDLGGNAAFFVSGTNVITDGDWSATAKVDDALIETLALRGITINNDLVLDESCWRMTLPSLDGSKYEFIDYPYWVTVNSDSTNPLFNGIYSLQFYWPSDIFIDTAQNPAINSLIESSASAIVETDSFDTDPFSKPMDRVKSHSGKSRRHLAVASATSSRLICVADEQFPGAMTDYTASDTNLDFLVNCAEWLSGKDDLLSVKKIAPSAAAPTVSEMKNINAYFSLSGIIMLVVLPLISICAYISARIIRRRKECTR